MPTISCHQAELDDNGIIFLQWMITHSGGESLTALSVDYVLRQGRTTQVLGGPPVHVSDNSLSIPSQPGAYYIFLVTATNTAGSTATECPTINTEQFESKILVNLSPPFPYVLNNIKSMHASSFCLLAVAINVQQTRAAIYAWSNGNRPITLCLNRVYYYSCYYKPPVMTMDTDTVADSTASKTVTIVKNKGKL